MSGNSKLISFSVCWSISIFCWIAPGGEKQYSLYLWNLWFRRIYHLITEKPLAEFYRNSHREVFLRKNVLKICSKFTGEHLYQRVISIKLLYNFHSVKSVRIRSYSGPYFPAFRLNTEINCTASATDVKSNALAMT